MVAPIRTPQARGLKCELCKKILALATWLDQTKLAKTEEDPKTVLNLIDKHNETDCPCIPRNIENLLVGSTHFEIHRLLAKRLDISVHKSQYEMSMRSANRISKELSKRRKENINDCQPNIRGTRFKIYAGYNDKEHTCAKLQLQHLAKAIDFWKVAMDDQANPFNSKLALRLGLTHHVIYSCYLFKYFRLLDYQVKSSNLLLNLFKSIEGVTTNAVSHANYLVVKTFMDCDQFTLARQYLKQAVKSSNYKDKTHYESILLTCASCELDLLENSYSALDELAQLAHFQSEDKLQHYYARTLAISIIMKYIHHYMGRSDQCFEFFHVYRYASAIMRRCYESSFDLVMMEKDLKQQTKQSSSPQDQILDHSWIRFAICDFAFSTFEQLSNFYIRAGLPECLELLYNGMNLITYRNGCYYWQSKMSLLGVNLDLLCDKYQDAESKLDSISHVIEHISDPILESALRIDLEVHILSMQQVVMSPGVPLDLLQRIKTCKSSLLDIIGEIDLFDCKTSSYYRLERNSDDNNNLIVIGNYLGSLSLKALKVVILSKLQCSDASEAKDILIELGNQLDSMKYKNLEYSSYHLLLEILLLFAEINISEQILLDASSSSDLILTTERSLDTFTSQMSLLSINSNGSRRGPAKAKSMRNFGALTRHSKRGGSYDVASKQERGPRYDIIDALKNFSTLTREEIVVTYLKNSEPNPDYLLYRRAQELMFCFRLKEENLNHEQLLYHFCESATSNTMRYRWMMFEEQQASPFDRAIPTKGINMSARNSRSINSFKDQEKPTRAWRRSMLDDSRLVQFKYILCSKQAKEHLLIVSFDKENTPIYAHVVKSILTNKSTLPIQLSDNIEEAKRTLFFTDQKSRIESRQKLETDLGTILNDLEDKWLGPFRFLLCSKTSDRNYSKLVEDIIQEILAINKNRNCNSFEALRLLIENAVLLTREEFCQMISILFNHGASYTIGPDCKSRDSFNKWQKMMESYLSGSNKISFLQALPRGQLGLILDKDLEEIPFESLPIVRIIKQGIFRIPSLRLFHAIAGRYSGSVQVDMDQTLYILDPASDLAKTRERFEKKLKSHTSWSGVISRPPKSDDLEQWLTEKEVYIFIGHGAGTTYYNKLCKGRGLSAMASVKSLPIVMGCSSGRVQAEGPKLESFGIGWVFILRGSPTYVGLLWDVTDTDIDRFLDCLLEKWMGSDWKQNLDEVKNTIRLPITDAVAQVRHVCKLELLVGSTPVVYGLPVWCKSLPCYEL